MSTTKAPIRKRLSADERRDQIVRSARAVFVRQGLGGSRTRDIAAEAGINEALLYRHFSSKEELFEAAVVEPLQEAVAHLLRDSMAPPENVEASRDEMVVRTRLFLLDLVKVMQEVAPLLGVMIFNGESSAGDHYKRSVAPIIKQVGDVVRANLGWWDHRDFDAAQIVRALFGAIWFESTSARLQNRRLNPDKFASELADMVILGLATRP
jgi:AcrR family transcriptional regulator